MNENLELSQNEKILNEIEKNILQYNMIQNGDKIVVALSGGPDSMCLLHALQTLQDKFKKKYNIQYTILVSHVNHMIRKESEDEKIYVEKYCKNNNIEFYYLKVDVTKKSKELKMSVEECGRKIRYDFFNEVCEKTNSNKIAVAHNLNDNVETILLNMIRGCGLKGLIGMEYVKNNIIRPMLSIEKDLILEYNNIYELNSCFDKTNLETIYLRNKVRIDLIPMLEKEYNSNFTKNIIRMREILSSDEEFLDKYANNIVNECIISKSDKKIRFNFEKILKEEKSIKYRAIRIILIMKLNNLEGIQNIHIMDISKLFKNNIKGKKYIIGNKFTIEIVSKNIATIY
ncbi:MAG: tRNA lysidine(34) synthetase TilS [Clostridia bacterium]